MGEGGRNGGRKKGGREEVGATDGIITDEELKRTRVLQ